MCTLLWQHIEIVIVLVSMTPRHLLLLRESCFKNIPTQGMICSSPRYYHRVLTRVFWKEYVAPIHVSVGDTNSLTHTLCCDESPSAPCGSHSGLPRYVPIRPHAMRTSFQDTATSPTGIRPTHGPVTFLANTNPTCFISRKPVGAHCERGRYRWQIVDSLR